MGLLSMYQIIVTNGTLQLQLTWETLLFLVPLQKYARNRFCQYELARWNRLLLLRHVVYLDPLSVEQVKWNVTSPKQSNQHIRIQKH